MEKGALYRWFSQRLGYDAWFYLTRKLRKVNGQDAKKKDRICKSTITSLKRSLSQEIDVERSLESEENEIFTAWMLQWERKFINLNIEYKGIQYYLFGDQSHHCTRPSAGLMKISTMSINHRARHCHIGSWPYVAWDEGGRSASPFVHTTPWDPHGKEILVMSFVYRRNRQFRIGHGDVHHASGSYQVSLPSCDVLGWCYRHLLH